MSQIIVIANQKGGVGKTTSTMNLGAALAHSGKRVLLVDSDPQANLTSYCRAEPGVPTLDELYLTKGEPTHEAALRLVTRLESHVGGGQLSLLAASDALSGVEYYLFSRAERELILRKWLSALRGAFDYILIDTPPSLNLLTLNALAAADSVLIPVQPEFFGLEGIVKIRETIESVRSRWNPGLTLLGVLPTQVTKRRKLTSEVLDALRKELGETVFPTLISDNAAVAESSSHGRSVIDYQARSPGSLEYQAAAQELVRRTHA